MARSHLCRMNHPGFGSYRAGSRKLGCGSARFARLGCMETTTSPTPVPHDEGVVASGVFESALSVQELAARLHVSSQTIYELRSQGRGPVGFG